MASSGLMAATLMLAIPFAGMAQGGEADDGYQLGMSIDTYPDRWQLPKRHADPLVTTPSSRMTLHAHLDNFFRPDEGYLFGLDGRVHWRDRGEGLDDRDVAARGEYDYQGMEVRALSGYRFGALGDAIRYDMRVGLGYLGANRDARMQRIGADDDMGLLYTQFSGGPRFASGNWKAYLEMGVRVPLALTEGMYGPGLPEGADVAGQGPRSGGFISFQNMFQLGDSSALRLDFYYDSQRFGREGPGTWQSLSRDEFINGRDRDVFGLEMGVLF